VIASSADLPIEGGVFILLLLLSTMIGYLPSYWILYGIPFILIILTDELYG